MLPASAGRCWQKRALNCHITYLWLYMFKICVHVLHASHIENRHANIMYAHYKNNITTLGSQPAVYLYKEVQACYFHLNVYFYLPCLHKHRHFLLSAFIYTFYMETSKCINKSKFISKICMNFQRPAQHSFQFVLFFCLFLNCFYQRRGCSDKNLQASNSGQICSVRVEGRSVA